MMKSRIVIFYPFYLLLLCTFLSCQGQTTFGTDYLRLEKLIELPGVKGRIDHMAINLKDQVLYVAALGNNSVEVVDLQKGEIIHSIKELDEPQGIAYIPAQNEIVIANGGNGNCVFYDANNYTFITSLHLSGDADNIRYSNSTGKIYVGYGDGGIAVIDAATHNQVGDVKLPAHPESFQIDQKNNLLFANLPGVHSIAIIDLHDNKIVNTLETGGLKENFPMTLDTAHSRFIVGFRNPALLVVYDYKSGKAINRVDLVSDADDIFYYEEKQQVFASGGGGYINIFDKNTDGSYKKVANIFTRSGARTSLLIPSLDTYLIAERGSAAKGAALAVYKIYNVKK
jgi:DNA-binding beta-propeller fold protein YncE